MWAYVEVMHRMAADSQGPEMTAVVGTTLEVHCDGRFRMILLPSATLVTQANGSTSQRMLGADEEGFKRKNPERELSNA